MIKNLVFDFGKVLVDYDFESFFITNIPDLQRCLRFAPVLHNETLQKELDREEQPFDVIMDRVISENREFEPEIRLFCDHYQEIITGEMAGMRDLLQRLKLEGFMLYGLTNWCSKVYATINQFEIFNLLDGYVISSEEHLIKPEPAIYQCLFNRFKLKPEECVFTDDKLENIEGSRAVGMEGILFENASQYERDLRRLLSEKNN